MPASPVPALAVSRALLRMLLVLNVVAGASISALLILSFAAPAFVFDGLGLRSLGEGFAAMIWARLMMAAAIAAAPCAYILFSRLLAIVGTVGEGDPFTLRNAGRLRACAWGLLGVEAMHLLVGVAAAGGKLPISWEFSPVGLLAVLLLFVLAQVFAQGAAMRDDLEGTV